MSEILLNKETGNKIETVSVREFLLACASKWIWFLVSLVVCVGLGILYILRQEPVYQRYEQILIKDQEAGGSISGMSGFSAMGLFSSSSSVQNELISITSPAVMAEVVKKLDLTVDYVTTSGLHDKALYGKTLPIIVSMPELSPEESGSFICELHPDGKVMLSRFEKSSAGEKIKDKSEISLQIGGSVKTILGNLKIEPNVNYQGPDISEPLKIRISKSRFQDAVEEYVDRLKGDLVDEFADIIDLSIKDVSIQRADDILKAVVDVYNADYLDDKNRIAKATSMFIDERLNVIEQELGDVDSSIAHYRSSVGTYSFAKQAMTMMEKSAEYEESIVTLSTQLELANYMKKFLDDHSTKFGVLPANVGMQNPEIDLQTQKYNEVLLERNSLIANSSENNPLVKDYDAQLLALQSAIRKSVDNQIVNLRTSLDAVKKEQSKANEKIKSTPTQSLPLLTEERQQKVKESLYLFLLEKREENELSQKFTADNTRIITPPTGSLKPVSPKKIVILFLAVLLGVAIPLVYYYVKLTGDNKVRGRKDLDHLQMPFAGEIPQVGKAKLKTNANSKKKIKIKDETAPLAVVEDGKRDVVNEAFRVIRSNIEFMSKGEKECQVIMLTSFNPGSGKSFISYNLALSFALKRKKVLLIDCDLRHGSSSMYIGLPNHGLTDYLVGGTDDWKKLIAPAPSNPNLMIMPIGKMPPNPAELLENGRLKELITEAEKEYDYIFLDCPPVNIVVDTQIVGAFADSTLFVVRAGLLDKHALPELNTFYQEQKFNHMSLILNGTDQEHSRYYSYGTYNSYVN